MISKDVIRTLNKYNKKHPQAIVHFLTDPTEVGFMPIGKIVLAYAPTQQIKDKKINTDDCIVEPKEGFEPIIVLG